MSFRRHGWYWAVEGAKAGMCAHEVEDCAGLKSADRKMHCVGEIQGSECLKRKLRPCKRCSGCK